MISSLKRHLVRMRTLEWVLMTWRCPYRERHRPEVVVHRWTTMGRGSERVATCEPRRETSEETCQFCDSPPPELQAINFHFFKPPSLWDFCYSSSRKLVHMVQSLCVSFCFLISQQMCLFKILSVLKDAGFASFPVFAIVIFQVLQSILVIPILT